MDINDRDLLAKTLQAEAGNQGLAGMLAAGSVIMNRTQTPGYGNGLRGVILKPGQFSAWNSLTGYAGGEQGQDMLNMRPSSAAYQAADKLLTGDYQDQTGGATHYYNPSISNPKWGQKRAGGDWLRIGDHIFGFADAGRGKRSPQATVSTKGTAPMTQQEEETPRGFLGGLGIQKMQEGAPGETGQRFYERDSFKDTAALLAQGFGRMGIMGLEEIADGIAKERTEAKAKNKTMEMLRKMPNGEELVKLAEVAGPKAVAEYVLAQRFAKPKDDRTAAMQNFSEYQRILAEQGKEAADQFRAMSGGQTFNLGDQVDAEGKLREKLMSKQGENFASYLDAGAKSAAAMQDLNVLQELTPLAPSGPVVGRLAEMFPEATDVAAVRQSIIKRVAPTLRVEGSGATSDLEFNAMLNSLGSLRNSPEANQAIIGVMQAKARYNMQRRKIINSYMTDGATLAETNNALAELDVNSKIPAAVQSILSTHGAGGEGVEAGVPSQGGPAIGTVNNGFRFKGGDPNNKNNWEPI